MQQREILNLAVSPVMRRTGVGQRLMAAMLEAADKAGCSESFLEVRRSNDVAIRLYRRYNFTMAGVRARYYRDGEDALIMKRLVIRSS